MCPRMSQGRAGLAGAVRDPARERAAARHVEAITARSSDIEIGARRSDSEIGIGVLAVRRGSSRLKSCLPFVRPLLSIGSPARTRARPVRSRSPVEDSGTQRPHCDAARLAAIAV